MTWCLECAAGTWKQEGFPWAYGEKRGVSIVSGHILSPIWGPGSDKCVAKGGASTATLAQLRVQVPAADSHYHHL